MLSVDVKVCECKCVHVCMYLCVRMYGVDTLPPFLSHTQTHNLSFSLSLTHTHTRTHTHTHIRTPFPKAVEKLKIILIAIVEGRLAHLTQHTHHVLQISLEFTPYRER